MWNVNIGKAAARSHSNVIRMVLNQGLWTLPTLQYSYSLAVTLVG
ncbi:MAG: hypothetical protein RIB93_06515 [Coleofasciculus sp. D1-CHI-01]